MSRASHCVLLLTLPLLFACQQGPKPLSDADKAAIRAANDQFVAGVLSKNFAGVAAEYAENATLLPPNEPAVSGRAAIQAWMANFPPTTAFKITIQEIDGLGDIAYTRGTYEMTLTPPGAPGPVSDHGKFLDVRRKNADGSWSLVNDMFSSDLPAAPPPAPALPAAKHK